MSDIVEIIGQTIDVVEITPAPLDIVEVVETAVDVVEISGPQGPTGPQGPAGPSGGEAYYTAAVDLGGHRAVCLTADGLVYANAATLAHAGVVAGITPGAVEAGIETSIVRFGEMVESSWTWTPGLPVFVGLNGVLTQTLPGTAVFAQVIGVATSPDSIFVRLREPLILGG